MKTTVPIHRGHIMNLPNLRLTRGDPIVNLDKFKQLVAEQFDMFATDLVSPTRRAWIVWPRQVAMALAYEHSPYSLQDVARSFGLRDHCTVTHAIRMVKERCEIEPEARDKVARLQATLRTNVG